MILAVTGRVLMHWSVQALVTGWSVFSDAQGCGRTDQVPHAALRSLYVLIQGWSGYGFPKPRLK